MNRRAVVNAAMNRWWKMRTGAPGSRKLARRLVRVLERIPLSLPRCTLRMLEDAAREPF